MISDNQCKNNRINLFMNLLQKMDKMFLTKNEPNSSKDLFFTQNKNNLMYDDKNLK